MQSNENLLEENLDKNNSGFCDFCGCEMFEDTVTSWQADKKYHPECFKIFHTIDSEKGKTQSFGIVISGAKIVNSH